MSGLSASLRKLAALGFLLGAASFAQAQQVPQQFPPLTVFGRLGISSGPGQAIPFAVLTGNLFSAMSGDCTMTSAGAITCTKTNGTALGTFATQNSATPPAIGGTTPAAGAFSTLSATGNTTTNVMGSTQCVQANSSGVLSGAGAPCASGTGAVNVSAYGAKCDGTTDDTTAITNAMAAVPTGGMLLFPPGVTCLVLGSGSTIFTRATPIIIDCQGATIKLSSSVGTSRDVIALAPSASGLQSGWRITQCVFNMNGTGKNVIRIDTTATSGTEMDDVWIDHNIDTLSGSTSGYSVEMINSSDANGGVYLSNIEKNEFWNGIFLNDVGDSIRIRDNRLTGRTTGGSNYGVYASLIANAAGLVISGNNMTAGCPIRIEAASGNVVISGNEAEQIPTFSSNSCPDTAMFDFRGGNEVFEDLTIIGNSINSDSGGTNSPALIYVSNADRAYVESNQLASAPTSTSCIVNATGIGASTMYVGAANEYSCTTTVSNNGTIHYVQVGSSP